MKTEREKAEAYVRSKIPELMELGFGCKVQYKGKEWVCCGSTGMMTDIHQGCFPYHYFFNCELNRVTEMHTDYEYEILGHPIHLESWLRVLQNIGEQGKRVAFDEEKGRCRVVIFSGAYIDAQINFSLTTGQPASELDYQLFNEITQP